MRETNPSEATAIVAEKSVAARGHEIAYDVNPVPSTHVVSIGIG